jgi:MFS family permease
MLQNLNKFIAIKEIRILAFLFCSSSLVFGIWVASLPALKERLQLTDASLGLSLFVYSFGALAGVSISTKVFSKIAPGKWMVLGYISTALLMNLQINAPNRIILCCCLFLFGVISFLNGVSTNSTVDKIEKKYEIKIMSTCHGFYSLGGFISACIAALFFYFNILSAWQMLFVAFFIITIILINRNSLLQHTALLHSKSKLQLPNGSILWISFICLVVFMTEGCVADWSAIYLKETLHSPKQWMSLGYAGFAIAMTIGRFNGDKFILKMGGKKVVVFGAILAALGFGLVAFSTSILMAICGYIFVGFGCCTIVPVLFSAAANIPKLSPVQGFAMVTSGGLIGFLTGPSLIGLISEKYNLATGFCLIIVLMCLVAVVGYRNKVLQ